MVPSLSRLSGGARPGGGGGHRAWRPRALPRALPPLPLPPPPPPPPPRHPRSPASPPPLPPLTTSFFLPASSTSPPAPFASLPSFPYRVGGLPALYDFSAPQVASPPPPLIFSSS